MNILITLPKSLLEKIISGEKKLEMRKCWPKNMKIGEDGFFVVEKGTAEIRCWCRVDDIYQGYVNMFSAQKLVPLVGVNEHYITKYANGKPIFLWEIGKVITFDSLARESLFVFSNPQQFAYCPLSYGESY